MCRDVFDKYLPTYDKPAPCNQSELIKALGGTVNEHDTDEPWCEPEDCEVCGCPSGDFEDTDWKCGCWYCPECGQPQ